MFKKYSNQKNLYPAKVEKLEGYEYLTPRLKKFLKHRHYTKEFLETFNLFCKGCGTIRDKKDLEYFLNKEEGLENIVSAIRRSIRLKFNGFDSLEGDIWKDVSDILYTERTSKNI